MIMVESPFFVYQVVAMVFFATIAILIYGIALTKPLLKVLAIPRTRLMPVVFVLCVIGSYAITGRIFDIWVMVGFGLFGLHPPGDEVPHGPSRPGHHPGRSPG